MRFGSRDRGCIPFRSEPNLFASAWFPSTLCYDGCEATTWICDERFFSVFFVEVWIWYESFIWFCLVMFDVSIFFLMFVALSLWNYCSNCNRCCIVSSLLVIYWMRLQSWVYVDMWRRSINTYQILDSAMRRALHDSYYPCCSQNNMVCWKYFFFIRYREDDGK